MAEIKALVEGGKASAGPPLGPALGPTGINVVDVIKEINEKTKDFAGMKVPVTVDIDSKTKSFSVEVGSPPTSALILKEIKEKKGSGTAGKDYLANSITLNQAKKVASMKLSKLNSYNEEKALNEVIGTCVSMGVQVEGKPAKEFIQELKQKN